MKRIIVWVFITMLLINLNGMAEQFTLTMSGHSMDPTISENDIIMFDNAVTPNRNDIVVCEFPNRPNMLFIKRVVGVPGDLVYRSNGVTHVVYEYIGQTIDTALDERYRDYFPNGSPDDYDEYTLNDNEYFVVGDNVYNSHDSRDWKDDDPEADVGPISKDAILGVAIGRLDSLR